MCETCNQKKADLSLTFAAAWEKLCAKKKLLMKDNIVSYELRKTSETVFGKLRVKRCMTPLHAKIKLDTFLLSKNKDYKSLILHEVRNDPPNPFDFIFG